MASLPIVALAVGAGAILYLGSKGGMSTSSTGGPVQKVTASSGRKWEVQLVKRIGNDAFFEVYAPAGALGPHARMLVMQYRQTGSNQSSRILASVPAGVPPEMLAAARQDFGV